MADELSVVSAVIDNERSRRYGGGGFDIDRSGDERVEKTQDIGTASEQLTLTPLSSPAGCLAYFKNHDETNYVEIRATENGDDILKLKAGEEYTIRLGSDVAALWAIANTAAVDLEYAVWED